MKTLYFFLHPRKHREKWRIPFSYLTMAPGQGGTICHSTWKVSNVMFLIHVALVLIKKLDGYFHKRHSWGSHDKSGFKFYRPENCLQERRPWTASDFWLQDWRRSRRWQCRLPPTPVLLLEEGGMLVHDMVSWQSSIQLTCPGCTHACETLYPKKK